MKQINKYVKTIRLKNTYVKTKNKKINGNKKTYML
jgi:hypothetical protein